MPKADFVVKIQNNTLLIDPFARSSVNSDDRNVSIDILTNELYVELSDYIPAEQIRFSLTTGRPIEELDEATANEMYKVLWYIFPHVERKVSESKIHGAYGLDRAQLEKLKKSLSKILAEKDAYLKEKFPKQDSDNDILRIDSDMGRMEYHGQQNNAHVFFLNYKDKHTFTVRLEPKGEEGVYLLTSTAMLSGANTPHFKSERYVDITRTHIEDEIGRERNSLERATDHATKNFWG